MIFLLAAFPRRPVRKGSRFCARKASSSFRRVEVHWEKTKHWTLGCSATIFWMAHTIASIFVQGEVFSSQGRRFTHREVASIAMLFTHNSYRPILAVLWSKKIQEGKSPPLPNMYQAQYPASILAFLTLLEIQGDRHLFRITVAGFMSFTGHMTTCHETCLAGTAMA